MNLAGKNRAEGLLAAVIIARSTSFVFNKLGLVCTGFGYTLQPVAQSGSTAQRAGLLCALSPAFANVFGAVLLHERITGLRALGMALILGSILLSHLLPAGRKTAPATNKE